MNQRVVPAPNAVKNGTGRQQFAFGSKRNFDGIDATISKHLHVCTIFQTRENGGCSAFRSLYSVLALQVITKMTSRKIEPTIWTKIGSVLVRLPRKVHVPNELFANIRHAIVVRILASQSSKELA